jgi:hypothetical protein
MRRKNATGKQRTALAVLLAALLAAPVATGDEARTAAIAGTVYRDTGFALRGAQVVVTGVQEGKRKEWKSAANWRGEFLVRVPAGPADYNVSVKASGYRRWEKPVTVGADERIELSVILEPDKGKR